MGKFEIVCGRELEGLGRHGPCLAMTLVRRAVPIVTYAFHPEDAMICDVHNRRIVVLTEDGPMPVMRGAER